MRRFPFGRWIKLIVALSVLVIVGWFYHAFLHSLPPRPKAIVQLDYSSYQSLFSPDGKLFVTRQCDEQLSMFVALDVWDAETGTKRCTLGEQWFERVSFSSDGTFLMGATGFDVNTGDALLLFWDRRTNVERSECIGGLTTLNWPKCTPDGKCLFANRLSQMVLWDIEARKELSRMKGDIATLQFSQDGKRFLVCDRDLKLDRDAKPYTNHQFTFWLYEMQEAGPPIQILERQVDYSGGIAFSPDLETYATATALPDQSNSIQIRLWDTSTRREKTLITQEMPGKRRPYLVFCGQFLLLTCGDNNWRGTPKWHSRFFRMGPHGGLQGIDFPGDPFSSLPVTEGYTMSPDDRSIVFPNKSGVDIWELSTAQKHRELRRKSDKSWTPETWGGPQTQFSQGKRLALITNLEANEPINLVQAVMTGQWSKINTTETYSVARLWDVDGGEEIASFRDCQTVMLSPDGRTVVTMDKDNTMRFYAVPPTSPLGLTLALTTATWGLFLLACWAIRRRYRRWRRSSPQRDKLGN